MDGRGAWRDNVFVGRLWRGVKYERVHLRACEGESHAKTDISDYIDWYNTERGDTSLESDQTPDAACWQMLPKKKIAA